MRVGSGGACATSVRISPDSFIAIVERAIDPDPVRRYATAGDMEAKLSGEPSTASLPVPHRRHPSPGLLEARRQLGRRLCGSHWCALGFIAARFFEVVVRIDREFSAAC